MVLGNEGEKPPGDGVVPSDNQTCQPHFTNTYKQEDYVNSVVPRSFYTTDKVSHDNNEKCSQTSSSLLSLASKPILMERNLSHDKYYPHKTQITYDRGAEATPVMPTCLPCSLPEISNNCPSYFHDHECPHMLECSEGRCGCNDIERGVTLYNLSKGTIKRHRRQETVPSHDFGVSKARALTKERIRQSMLPFQNAQDLCYDPVAPQELFTEFLNMLQGKFKKDMLEYLVREAKVLPILDIELVQSKRTYTKTELQEFAKAIGFREGATDIEKLISQCHSFILDEPQFIIPDDPLEKDLPSIPMTIDKTQQDKEIPYAEPVHVVDYVKKGISHGVNKVNIVTETSSSPQKLSDKYCKERNLDIERTEFIFRSSPDTLTASMACNDSGSNIQLISVQKLKGLGGKLENIKKTSINLSNSSGECDLVFGEIDMEMYCVNNKVLIYMGTYKFTVIDNKDFNEILLGMECLTSMKQQLQRSQVTKGSFTGVSCPNGKSHVYHYQSNCPNLRRPTATKNYVIRKGRKSEVVMELQISVADYIFCSEEMSHQVFSFNTVKINPSWSHKRLRYSDVSHKSIIKIKPVIQLEVNKGEDIMNDLAYPDHFDCDCRSDVHDLCDTSTAFYVDGETQKYHMGHAIVDYPLSAMDFKNGIDIDHIREQPEGDEVMLQHLSPEVKNKIIDINNKYRNAFNSEERPIGEFTGKEFTVPMDPNKIFYQKPIDHKGERGRIVDREIAKLLACGVVEPASTIGKDNIPCFPVGKTKGKQLIAQKLGQQNKSYDSHRLVLDMRLANQSVPGHGGVLLPSQDDLLCRMHAKFTACLDISAAFHCLKYSRETKERMRFIHRGKSYLFTRAIMGGILSSQHLEEATNLTFNHLHFSEFLKEKGLTQKIDLGDLLLVYCDDIILSAESLDQFYLIYEFCLRQLQLFGLALERKKLKILTPVTTILGYDFQKMEDGVMTHSIKQSKIQQFLDLPQPQNKRMVSSYLASCAIYFKNIIGLKLILAPLYLFLRSESNVFEYVHFRCLSILRLIMSLNLSQACMDPDKILTLFSDSSLVACHGFSAQFHFDSEDKLQLVPILNSSKVFDRTGLNQPSIHKECYAILNIVKQCEHLIRGNKVGSVAITDCRPLALALKSRSTTQSLAESAIYLSSLPRFRVHHLRGAEIKTSDLCSRLFSFGLAKKRKFDQDKAMLFKSDFFGNLFYKISDLEKLIEERDDAHYFTVSPIKAGKSSISDLYCRIMENDTETEYFRGLLKGFEAINKKHSLWRPGIKNDNRDEITKAEFESFIKSGSFKEMRDGLNKDNIKNNNIFYHINHGSLCQGRPEQLRLFVSGTSKVQILPQEPDSNILKVKIIFNKCPDGCYQSPVPGPQLMLQSTNATLSLGDLPFKILSEYLVEDGCHGFPEITYQCDKPHQDEVQFTISIKGENVCSQNLDIINHPRMQINDYAEKCLAQKIKTNYLGMACWHEKAEKGSGPETREAVLQKINSQAATALLLIAQASHFGRDNFHGFLYAMQRDCPEIKNIIDCCKGDRYISDNLNFSLDKNEVLWCSVDHKSSRLVVTQDFITILVSNLHGPGPVHLSHRAMSALICRVFVIIGKELIITDKKFLNKNKKMINDICSRGAECCIKCILSKPARIQTIKGPARHLETSVPGSVWSVDILETLPKSPEGYTAAFICSDRASNFTIALAQKSTTAEESLRSFISIYTIVGSGLRALESDGSQTFNKISRFLCGRGIIHKRFGPRSSTQGQAENSVKLIRHLLHKAVFDIDPAKRHLWPGILADCCHSLNNCIVKPQFNKYTRRELYFNQFSGASDLSACHVQDIYDGLVKLRQHREECIRKLAAKQQNTPPPVSLGDICVMLRSKHEILPAVTKEKTTATRALLPPTAGQLYRITAISPLFVRCNSLLDDSHRTLARNKIRRLTIDQWIDVHDKVPGLLQTLFYSNRFQMGKSIRPAFSKLKQSRAFDKTQMEKHLDACLDPAHCSMMREVPAFSFLESDDEPDTDFVMNKENSVLSDQAGDARHEVKEDEGGEQDDHSDEDQPQEQEDAIPVMTGLDDSTVGEERPEENRRVTRSMTKKVNFNKFRQVVTDTATMKIPIEKQGISILRQQGQARSYEKKVSFSEADLLTLFLDSDHRWLSTWVQSKGGVN